MPMGDYGINNELWSIPRPDSFTQLPDDDFIALLQKQFPPNGIPLSSYDYSVFPESVNPQSLNSFPLPTPTPPSEDSSPSPPSNNDSDDHEPPLKRKAGTVDENSRQPNSKSQHTLANDKKGASGNGLRRKSGGGPDEARQIKRKEQNRAAQRAFRERKERHVKDLEDKVAELESQNELATSENENLRDLLSRLQNENMMLKQSSFTFSVPKTAGNQPPSSFMPDPAMATDNLDWSSLTSLDPSVLSLLDDSPSQMTATDGAQQMDFGFGTSGAFTTIASNPSFMSFASAFDDPPSSGSNNSPQFSFDQNSGSSWGPSSDPDVDEIFNSCGPIDFQALMNTTPSLNRSSVSPIQHRSSPSTATSSPSILNTPKDSYTSSPCGGSSNECPKTKEQFREHMASQGPSMFVPTPNLTVKETGDSVFGPTIMCRGSSFPKTPKSDSNVPVLSAWRTITSNPEFKDADINELCAEFTSKARCDGTKVVLEPQGVHHIMETFSSAKSKKRTGSSAHSPSDMRL